MRTRNIILKFTIVQLVVCVNVELKTRDAEFQYRKNAILDCTPSVSGINVYWETSNGTRIKDLVPLQPTSFEEASNGSLIILTAVRDYADVYYCCYDDVSGKVRQPANLYAEHKVIMTEESSSMRQGDDFNAICLVLGHPKPKVVWYRDHKAIRPGGRFIIKDTTVNGYPAQQLIIKRINFDDAANYRCEATSIKYPGVVHSAVKLRVLDKYAFVWPLVGIIVQILLVFTIVLIHEYKQLKEERRCEAEEEKQFQRRETRNHRRS